MDSPTPRPNLSTDKAYLTKTRDMLQGRGELEELHFEYLTEALLALGENGDVFGGISDVSIPDTVKETIERAFETLLRSELSPELVEKLIRLWDYLAQSDPLEHADLVYVFGGISELAVREAIRLKLENYAPRILFSGKHGSYMKEVTGVSEAEKYAQLAVESGVSRDDILLEKESINTVENVVNSAKMLHDLGLLPAKLIAVSLPYHLKRATLTLRAAIDWDCTVLRHAGPSAKYARDTFYKDKHGWSYICFEYIKLYMARQSGHF